MTPCPVESITVITGGKELGGLFSNWAGTGVTADMIVARKNPVHWVFPLFARHEEAVTSWPQ